MADPAASLPARGAADRGRIGRGDLLDLDGLAEVFADPEVWRHPYGRGFTREETERFLGAQMQEWAEFGFGCWIALLREMARS